jgi:hypothetical protein
MFSDFRDRLRRDYTVDHIGLDFACKPYAGNPVQRLSQHGVHAIGLRGICQPEIICEQGAGVLKYVKVGDQAKTWR